MKAVATRLIPTLAGITLALLFLTSAMLVGYRAMLVAARAQDNLWLVALAFGGAALSVVNSLSSGRTLSCVSSIRKRA